MSMTAASTTTISHTISRGEPAFHTLVERVAIAMLRWSERQAVRRADHPAGRSVTIHNYRDDRCVEFQDARDRAIEIRRAIY